MDAPFANLPPELLLAITAFTDRSTIFRLAAVCRYWHDVLTGTATLWTYIDCRNESRTSILLQRSKSSPIDVAIDRYVPAAISLIARHTHRMRSIDLNLPSRQFGDIRPLLNGLAPILKTMRMRRRGEVSPPGSYPPCNSFFQGKFPALRTLHLEGYPLFHTQSAPTMTGGLTTLVLDNRLYHDRRDLLEYLEHCKNLVHLRIDLPVLGGTVPASRVVSLPNLTELRSVRSALTAFHNLSFPPSTDLIIGPRCRVHPEGYPLATVWERDGLSQILELRAIRSVRMTFDVSNCMVALSGPHLLFMEDVKADTSRHNSFYSDYLDSFQSLPITTTEVFRFIQPPQRPFTGTLQLQSCTRLLLQMPKLTRIFLDASVALFFVRALEPVDGQVPCPKLQALVVIPREGREDYLRNGLITLSNQRKDRGCPLVCSVGPPDLPSRPSPRV